MWKKGQSPPAIIRGNMVNSLGSLLTNRNFLSPVTSKHLLCRLQRWVLPHITCLLKSLRDKGLFSTAIILQIAHVVQQDVLLLFLLCFWVTVCLFLPHETSKMFRHFVLTTKTTQPHPRSSQLTVQFSGNYAPQLTSFFTYHKILSNFVDSSWLWWIMYGILANQKWRHTLNE